MDILKVDRNWNDKAAYKEMIEIFTALGAGSDVVVKARKRLSKILF